LTKNTNTFHSNHFKANERTFHVSRYFERAEVKLFFLRLSWKVTTLRQSCHTFSFSSFFLFSFFLFEIKTVFGLIKVTRKISIQNFLESELNLSWVLKRERHSTQTGSLILEWPLYEVVQLRQVFKQPSKFFALSQTHLRCW
jgi:hypothetical protein